MLDTLKTHVSETEARVSVQHVLDRWEALDQPGREAFLNGVRFTELRGGALLAYLAESVEADRDARRNIMRQARDEAKHGYYFSLILEHLGLEEHRVTDNPIGLDGNPNDVTLVDEATRVLMFMISTEAIELRAAVVFEALDRIFAGDPFVSRYLSEIRYDEMFHLGWIGARLDALAAERPEITVMREQARDGLAAALAQFEARADAAARARLASH